MNRTYRQLTNDETEALWAFAEAHGRRWKTILNEVYWYNARLWRDGPNGSITGSILHNIRNEFGPTWLFDRCKLQKGVKA